MLHPLQKDEKGRYTEDAKQRVLGLSRKVGVTEAAKICRVYPSQIYDWRRKEQYILKPRNTTTSVDVSVKIPTPRHPVQESPSEIMRLQNVIKLKDQEIEFLKKASVYFAAQAA